MFWLSEEWRPFHTYWNRWQQPQRFLAEDVFGPALSFWWWSGKMIKTILRKFFPTALLKQCFLIYNKVKIRTVDKVLYPEYKVQNKNFGVYCEGYPFRLIKLMFRPSREEPSISASCTTIGSNKWNVLHIGYHCSDLHNDQISARVNKNWSAKKHICQCA